VIEESACETVVGGAGGGASERQRQPPESAGRSRHQKRETAGEGVRIGVFARLEAVK
jgi:hypothetical protein